MRFILTIAVMVSTGYLFGQGNFEAGFFGGFANYQGDLAEKHIQFDETKLAYGGILRYHFNTKLSTRAHLFVGNLEGDDANSKDLKDRMYRFNSTIIEIGMIGEWNILGKERFNNVGVFLPYISPVLYGGVAYALAEATTECYHPDCIGANNPFPEEGAEKNFLVLPFGVGIQLNVLEHVNFGFDFGYRLTFSDYIDGVSENGRSDKNDWYFFTGITASFKFGNMDNGFNL